MHTHREPNHAFGTLRVVSARAELRSLLVVALCTILVALGGCHAEEPVGVTREVVHLHGDGYQRGLQHGSQLKWRIRAFYTKLLTVALYPNLGREQPAIAGFLTHYQEPQYQDGKFSYQLLVEMAHSVEPLLPQDIRDEMRGIADGSGLSYDEVMVLNTFADTVLAVRAIAATLKLSRGPRLESVQFLGKLDGKGQQANAMPYVPLATAVTTAVPTDAQLRLVLTDPEGVDPATVHIVLGAQGLGANGQAVFEPGMPGYAAEEVDATHLAVTLSPVGGLPAGVAVGVLLSAGDKTIAADPPPAHPRFGRDEGFTFTTVGDARAAAEVDNIAPDDGRSRPPPIALAVRKGATKDGGLLLAQHFALLDAGASSDATVVLVHHPETGPAWTTIGWAGVAYGFSGMSASGLTYACNFSDTLDNAIVKDLLPKVSKLPQAQLTASGIPIGFAMRAALRGATTVAEALEVLRPMQHIMGWECLLGDATGEMRAIEVDGDARLLPAKTIEGLHVIDGDAAGKGAGKAGATADELRLTVHFLEHVVDVDPTIGAVAAALLEPTGVQVRIDAQSVVSTYWLKSLRTFGQLGEALAAGRGTWTVASLQALLSEPRFVDTSDSMNAVVYEPTARKLHVASGTLPATDATWLTVELTAEAP